MRNMTEYNQKRLRLAWILMAVCFAIGISIGAVYAVRTSGTTDKGLSEYLTGFFQNLQTEGNRFSVFCNAFFNHAKLFGFLFVCAFFRLGSIGIGAGMGVKGFSLGFTTAACVKYYGTRGLLVSASSLFANLILFPAMLFFAAYTVCFSRKKQKKDKNLLGSFFLVALICFTIFCVSAFFEGYVTTTFIKLFVPFFVRI